MNKANATDFTSRFSVKALMLSLEIMCFQLLKLLDLIVIDYLEPSTNKYCTNQKSDLLITTTKPVH